MIEKKEDNIRSESYYPDSNYYLDQDNSPKETPFLGDQISSMGSGFEWPNSYCETGKNKWKAGNDRFYGCHY